LSRVLRTTSLTAPIYRRPHEDKAETAPLFPPSTSMSPSVPPPISSGTATINRTLLHSQQYTSHTMGHHHGGVGGGSGGGGGSGAGPHHHGAPHARNGNARGLANHLNGDSPPPTYDDVHDISLQRHGFFFSSYHFYTFVCSCLIVAAKCVPRLFHTRS
jgi:hypothetical protein